MVDPDAVDHPESRKRAMRKAWVVWPGRRRHCAVTRAAVGPYSQGVSTGQGAGSLVFVSGQVPLDPATGALVEGDIQAQAEQVLKNVGAILAEAGLGYDDVVKTTVLLADIADFAAVNEVYARYFTGETLPARAAFGVAALPLGAGVEIEAIAARS